MHGKLSQNQQRAPKTSDVSNKFLRRDIHRNNKNIRRDYIPFIISLLSIFEINKPRFLKTMNASGNSFRFVFISTTVIVAKEIQRIYWTSSKDIRTYF